ncbi:MAG TPA: hypothetical protein VE422_15080 [Terriglobia bacterium]|nr:hypothetical protein [Terriglobia bacterium]
MKKYLLVLALLVGLLETTYAQDVEAYNTSVLAGRPTNPMIVDGVGEDSRFEAITAMWGDSANLYVADSNTVRRIEPSTAQVTTLSRTASTGVAHAGSYFYLGLYGLWGDGTFLYATDIGADTVRRIDLATGGVQTLAGSVFFPWGLSGKGNNLYVAASARGQVMQVDSTTGRSSEFAVTGAGTPRECTGGSGCFGYLQPGPRSSWSDSQSLYLTGYSGTVKKVDLATAEQTFLPAVPFNIGPITGTTGRLFVAAKTGSQLGSISIDTGEFTPIALPADKITALWTDGSSLYVAVGDPQNRDGQAIRRVDLSTGAVFAFAGVVRTSESADGVGAAARLQNPEGIWGDDKNLYVVDQFSFTIRVVDRVTGAVSLLAGQPGVQGTQDGIGPNASFALPHRIWGEGRRVYITDANSIRSINLDTAEVITLAGIADQPGAVDGIGSDARFRNPTGLWSSNGILYVCDSSNTVIRKLDLASGTVTTLAGAFVRAGTNDGTGADARFQLPTGLWGDGTNLYVSDFSRIRSVSISTAEVKTVATVPYGNIRALWGRGRVVYALSAFSVSTAYVKNRVHIYRIDLDSGRISEPVYGQNESTAGQPILLTASQPIMVTDGEGVWGDETDLFITEYRNNTIRHLTRDVLPSLARIQVATPGYSSRITTGNAAAISVGHAAITVEPGSGTPSGFAVFALRQNGVLISEASVPAAPAIRSGRISATAAGVVNTGLAIANPNSVEAVISFYFTDAAGRNYGQGSFTVAPGAQVARFLTEDPYKGPATIEGTFTFVSSVPIGAVALRSYVNERSEFLMTTLPVVDLARRSSAPATVTHYAAGGGWTTELLLVNPSDQAISGTVQPIGGGTAFRYGIPSRTSQKFLFEGTADAIRSGAFRVIPETGMTPSAACIFSFVKNGVRVTEATVPDVPTSAAFHAYAEIARRVSFGEPGSIRSGFAVTNTSAAPVDVTVEVTNSDGVNAPLTGGSGFVTGTIHIEAMSHVSMFLDELPGQAGQVLLGFAPGPFFLRLSTRLPDISVVGLRGRYNERGDFLITTTPAVAEDTAPDTSPLYFPHIVDGGGYTTQFVIFGATAQSVSTSLSATTRYFTQTGAPMRFPAN